MDNLPSEHKSLTAEHGLSFYVDLGHTRLLFDFGAGANTLKNARKLGISPEKIDLAVISHGHYDHASGYPSFVEAGLRCPLFTGEGFFAEKYALDGIRATYLGTGFSPALLKETGIQHTQSNDLISIAPGCFLLGNFKRKWEFETIPGRFVLRENEGWKQDTFSDEICLVVQLPEGIAVIVGCSHPGILNILDTVREHFNQPIVAVMGGTHLVEAGEERIRKTIDSMKGMGIRLIGFNHCSGPLLKEMLQEEKQLNTVYLGAGDSLFL